MPLVLLLVAAQLTTKAQMTVGGSYKPSHTLVVKGQVKIDTVKSGSIVDSLLTIGADSVLHRLSISSISDGSQTRVTAGTNTTVTGTGTIATPYVVNSVIPATSHTLGVTGNTLTSTVNGVSANASVIGSLSSTSTGNTISTTINGQTSSGVNIINSNANALTQAGGLVNTVNGISATTAIPAGTAANVLGFSSTGTPVYQTAASVLGGATTHTLGVAGNTLTSTVNGVPATASLIGTISNTSTGNTISTSINGQSGSSVNIINTNTNALSQSNGLVTTVNGIAATTAIPTGTVSNVLGYSSTGTPVYQSASTVLSGATTNTSSLTQAGGLVNTINGVAATTAIPSGTASNLLGFSSTGTPVYQSPAAVLAAATTNTVTTTSGTLTSTVNGKVATAPVLVSASNGLTATSGNVALGGALTAATTITGAANKLSITSTATDGFAVDGTTLSVDAANHRVGFGTAAPATSLDVRGATAGTALRIADGSQGADKVLISDASGNASWATFAGNTKVVWGTLSATSSTYPLSANKYTGSFITLPPGKWTVNITMTLSTTNATSPNIVTGAGLWERATLSDVSTGTTGAASLDIIGAAKQVAGGMTGPNDYGLLAGSLMISNTSGANKTYYFWHKAGISYSPNILSVLGVGLVLGASSSNSTTTVSLANFGSTAWSEDELFATPINY